MKSCTKSAKTLNNSQNEYELNYLIDAKKKPKKIFFWSLEIKLRKYPIGLIALYKKVKRYYFSIWCSKNKNLLKRLRERVIKEGSYHHCMNMSKYGVFPRRHFPVFGLNTDIYRVSLRFQSKYGNIRTRKKAVFGHFSLISWDCCVFFFWC